MRIVVLLALLVIVAWVTAQLVSEATVASSPWKSPSAELPSAKQPLAKTLPSSKKSPIAKANSCQHDANNFRCVKYLKNYDADTITFDIPAVHPLLGKKISIRVNGIDTPEIRTKDSCERAKAKKAKQIVQELLIKARRIDLQDIDRGKYFRIVADVIIDGRSLTKYLLANKLGYPYDGGKKQKRNWCDPK